MSKVFFFFICYIYILNGLSYVQAETSYPSFDIFTSSGDLSLGGSGYLNATSLSSKINPASKFSRKIFSTSILKYPALITSENIGLTLPIKSWSRTLSIRHVTYGTFQGYDEYLEKTKKYTSNELWLAGTLSKKIEGIPLRFGSSAQIFRSSLSNKEVYLLDFSFGTILEFKKNEIKIGFSVHQLGKSLFKKAKGSLSNKIVFSTSKRLKHLPFQLLIDLIKSGDESKMELFFGGILDLNNEIKFKFGTSSRKMKYDINQSVSNSILGATGFGFSYNLNSLIIGYGSFIYVNGIIIHGLEIGIPLK